MVMSDEEKAVTAYHEAGHAIVGLTVPDHDPVYKVTIIPRGRALGVTMFLPEEDRYSLSRQRLKSQISSLFGGRIAEALIFGEEAVTTGASNDIERATEMAKNMVTKWGLSEKLGPLKYAEDDDQPFLGMSASHKPMAVSGETARMYMGQSGGSSMSDQTANLIDEEVRRLINENYDRAENILNEKMDILHLMAKALIKYETIDEKQIAEIMQGKEPSPPEGWMDNDQPPSGTAPDVPSKDSQIGGTASAS